MNYDSPPFVSSSDSSRKAARSSCVRDRFSHMRQISTRCFRASDLIFTKSGKAVSDDGAGAACDVVIVVLLLDCDIG
jgi:hypothetical protein